MTTDYSSRHSIAITPELVEEWIETLDPSIRTFVANFNINTMRQYSYDYDAIPEGDDRDLTEVLSRHFSTFLKLKFYKSTSGRTLTRISLMPMES